MLAALGFGYWDDWELQAKVTFDGVSKLITVNPGVANLDIRTEVWTEYIQWEAIRDNSKYGEGMRFIGLDPVPDGKGGFNEAGDIYFLTEGWRMIIDLTITAVSGVLTSDNFPTAYFTVDKIAVFPAQVSSIVNSVLTTENVITGDISIVPTAQETAAAVWAEAVRTLTVNSGLTAEESAKLLSLPTKQENAVAVWDEVL